MALAPSSLVVNCYSGVAAGEDIPISQVEVGLGPDGALEEGQQDVRDGLDGAKDQGVAATVDSRVEGKSTGLALREVGWADASCGSFFQEVVTVISARSKAQAIDVQAGDLDWDHSLQHQVERHGGSSGQWLVQGDLDGKSDAGSVLNEDREWLHADVVDRGWLRTSVTEAVLNLGWWRRKTKAQIAQVESRAGGDEEGKTKELHGDQSRIQRRLPPC